jgi:hypothetical protein
MNRPPQPSECVELLWFTYFDNVRFQEEYDCMQEALTCEWDIERGMMPDPTETIQGRLLFNERGPLRFIPGVVVQWFCEDKTK